MGFINYINKYIAILIFLNYICKMGALEIVLYLTIGCGWLMFMVSKYEIWTPIIPVFIIVFWPISMLFYLIKIFFGWIFH